MNFLFGLVWFGGMVDALHRELGIERQSLYVAECCTSTFGPMMIFVCENMNLYLWMAVLFREYSRAIEQSHFPSGSQSMSVILRFYCATFEFDTYLLYIFIRS